MRRYTWALAILCFLVILLAAPLLISDRYSRIALQSGAVFAASTNSYSLCQWVSLLSCISAAPDWHAVISVALR